MTWKVPPNRRVLRSPRGPKVPLCDGRGRPSRRPLIDRSPRAAGHPDFRLELDDRSVGILIHGGLTP